MEGMYKTEGVLPGETAESILAGIRKLSGEIALQDFQRDVEQERVSQEAQSAGTEGPGWDRDVAEFFGSSGFRGGPLGGRDGFDLIDLLGDVLGGSNSQGLGGLVDMEDDDDDDPRIPDGIDTDLPGPPPCVPDLGRVKRWVQGYEPDYANSLDAMYHRICPGGTVVLGPDGPCDWWCDFGEGYGRLKRPCIPPECGPNEVLVLRDDQYYDDLTAGKLGRRRLCDYYECIVPNPPDLSPPECAATWPPGTPACWAWTDGKPIGDDYCGCPPAIGGPKVCFNSPPSALPQLYKFKCKGYNQSICDEAESMLDSAFSWLWDNQDLVEYITCVMTGIREDAECIVKKVTGVKRVKIVWDRDADPGFLTRSNKITVGDQLWSRYLGTWRQASAIDRDCLEMDLAGTLLHEMMHTCGPFSRYEDIPSGSGAGGTCKETYIIENSFRYALSLRYPCVNSSVQGFGCDTWTTTKLWGCDGVVFPPNTFGC